MVVDLQPSLGTLPVILDTEIGGEPDDAMALVVAARELPELALVVTSDEFRGQRARFARYLLDSAGRADVAVVAGASLSANPPFFADGLTPDRAGPVGLTPDRAGPVPGDVAQAVAGVCARSGGVARWIGLGPLSNLAALLAQEPGLGRRLFVTQLTGTWASSGQALPPRNFRLDPAAASRVLASAHHLRLVSYDLADGQRAQLTAGSPVIRQLTGAAPAWAAVLAAHCAQFFARYHPAVVPAGPLALAAALRLRFAPFGPARVTVDGTGSFTVRRSGSPSVPGQPGPEPPAGPQTAVNNVLISHNVDYQALADWLCARLQPGMWTQWARPPGLSRTGPIRRRRAVRV